jgi:hypothetical protein
MKLIREVMPLKLTLMLFFFTAAAATIAKWTFRLMRWMQNLYQSMWGHKILYYDKIIRG